MHLLRRVATQRPFVAACARTSIAINQAPALTCSASVSEVTRWESARSSDIESLMDRLSLMPMPSGARGIHMHATKMVLQEVGQEKHPDVPAGAAAQTLVGGNQAMDEVEEEVTSTHASRVIKTSLKKLHPFAKLITKMPVEAALIQMELSPKKNADEVRKCLLNAKANAENNFGLDPDLLIIQEAWVGKAQSFKKLKYHGRGRTGTITMPWTRITIVVKEVTEEELKEARMSKKKRRSRARLGQSDL